MKKFNKLGALAVVSSLALGGVATSVRADEFIGFGQAGKPGSWALEEYPTFSHTGPNSNSISTYNELSYFTESGFTGTHRDQFEFWVGTSTGYANTQGAPNASGAGFASPGLGFEYYYNVIVPDAKPGTPGYVTFWTSPTLTVNFPNGSRKDAGFGAGANEYSYGLNWANYIQIGKFAVTANPVEIFYASHNLNATTLSNGEMRRLTGGASLTLMDVAAGYEVHDDLFAGIHHAYDINSWRGSDFAETREGKIGPSLTYLGFAKYGLYILGNVNFDYYTSSNMKKSVSVTMSIVKNL